ncbi:transcription-repair coupling factor [Chlorobaculum thiosulfatiphilum]|uniref:Transcription-repair-coupling factor n=1 Tax=Chlorobaculum thiosulfatiphilum TaxID=115852 RepID=A0A5C4S6Q7_CHLTI|nr:transcription-repair coupling factor [Chlorobaculum thiosulfatiphilum]TNJ39174.1 transcription-repair coupling factor [Chlorobaculum thiosulfatiphilum]
MKAPADSAAQFATIVKKPVDLVLDSLAASATYRALREALATPVAGGEHRPASICGVRGSLAPFIAAGLAGDFDAPVLLLCSPEAEEVYDNDLPLLLEGRALCNTADELSPALGKLSRNEPVVVLAAFEDLGVEVCSAESSNDRVFSLAAGSTAGYDALMQFLKNNGFEKREFVENEGEFSVRGSIIDVFCYGGLEPVRIEFFGDTVSSLRNFDTDSQLSTSKIESVDLFGSFTQDGATAASHSGILDYLPESAIIVIDDATAMQSATSRAMLEAALPRFRHVVIHRIDKQGLDFGSSEQQRLQGNFRLLAGRLREEAERGLKPLFACASRREIEELAEFIADENADKSPDAIEWIPANLHSGFAFGELNLYTESDIFGKFHTHKTHRKRKVRGISLKELQRLKVGDYVVHEDYGVGVFRSLETIQVGDSEQECVLVEYEGGDQLFVNVQNINLLSKYTASEGSLPSLSKLGSSKWSAKKEKVRKKLRDIAAKLIRVYAERKMTPGFAFGPDSIFQREFEASFMFEETPDQLKAIQEVKKDMQSPSPMDRLICGDAGFGKTEIAMRAAFKAVEGKKQVAILTPTTILTHQHGESFARRFENFPVNIAVLSRFVPRKQQKEIIERIASGAVDIVIGTHRLVSKDVVFKDLGLLVIDEEQHFGVEVKEKLRHQFPGVDTLTMSATPIPRTMQFSMLGARDISIVSTPPKNRQPVETIITEYDSAAIQSAIRREIQREGQIFFLHNRVASLEETERKLRELVPYARMASAHGQMPAKELENVMMDFMQQELDVLISTSIIGSGLDISNANTIIINRADMFGLSDLYQLRGRVGRSERKAYCYLVTPPLHTLKREAIQRIAVIESFTELGSGINVALRDLDIRGAGNLLGAEQSGFIHEIGFDLYQKMIEETVAELKLTEFSHIFSDSEKAALKPQRPCDMIFFFDALLPDYYITATQERFSCYDRISKAADDAALRNIARELEDRFGAMPEEVRNLLALARLKHFGSSLGLEKIDLQPSVATIFLPSDDDKEFYDSAFFKNLIVALQDGALKEYHPQFRHEKKMKLVFQHPAAADTAPLALIDRYEALLKAVAERAVASE